MWSYRAHSSVKNLLKFTRKLLWNLLENYFGIYSKITWKFTRKLLGNLLENYLGIYSKLTVGRLCYGTFTKRQFLQYVSTVHAVPYMSINGHVAPYMSINGHV